MMAKLNIYKNKGVLAQFVREQKQFRAKEQRQGQSIRQKVTDEDVRAEWGCVNVCVLRDRESREKIMHVTLGCAKQDVPDSLFFSAVGSETANVLLSSPASDSFDLTAFLPLLSLPKVSLRHKSKKKSRGGKLSPLELSSLCLRVCPQL